MQEPPENEVAQVGPPPKVVITAGALHIGTGCRACGRRSWLRLSKRRAFVGPGKRSWRCRCGNVGELGVGK